MKFINLFASQDCTKLLLTKYARVFFKMKLFSNAKLTSCYQAPIA
jgi:hypothetical protein